MSESAGLEGADDQYNLRSNFTLKRNFSYHGAKTWNNLPTELKNLTISKRVFKNKLQDFIRENNSFLNNFSSCQ